MLHIRAATRQDATLILSFIRELAEYEREPDAARATEADIVRDGFTEPRRFHCLIAEWKGQPAGFALYFYNYSTWRGHTGVYLEDLFVRPAVRGNGIGRALIAAVAAAAVAEGCPRLEWAVLDWNTPAIEFYRALGAVPMSEWTTMRLTGDALAALAGTAKGASSRAGEP